ncbi:MAG TPA: metallophosphoesterase, partial [Candidatus Brocadiia bacterium]|nr:metallophosphoesterase [Candidatus Brocadiia bacterium]
IWNAAFRVAARWAPAAGRWVAAPRPVAVALGCLVVALLAWGLVEARLLRVNTFTLRTPRLAPGSKPIRVVQISDLHLGLLERDGLLKRVAGAVERLEPDLLVCTGDMLDSTGAHMDGLSSTLAAIRPPLGKFAVTGNHDYYAGLDESLAFHERSGFRVLRQESALVDGRLRVAGVDDPAGAMTGARPRLDEDKALPPPGPREFTILLKHRPGVRPHSEGRFDLQLSGHTHGGQIFPFTEFERLEYGERRSGFFRLADGAHLYISRGTGTWGPPLRVLAPPEVTLFVIEPDQAR